MCLNESLKKKKKKTNEIVRRKRIFPLNKKPESSVMFLYGNEVS